MGRNKSGEESGGGNPQLCSGASRPAVLVERFLATVITMNSFSSRPQALLARALYDNHPDCSYELAFCRGDILTILEQNVPESEGWWKCLLHGRQGLAPANRLQLLLEAPADRPCAPFLKGLEEALTTSEGTYQVPTLLKPQTPGPVYEHMKSWVEGPLPTTAQVYEFPDLPSRARIVCEKTLSLPKQVSMLPNKTGGSQGTQTQGLPSPLSSWCSSGDPMCRVGTWTRHDWVNLYLAPTSVITNLLDTPVIPVLSKTATLCRKSNATWSCPRKYCGLSRQSFCAPGLPGTGSRARNHPTDLTSMCLSTKKLDSQNCCRNIQEGKAVSG